ncbi:MAG: type II secretion system protein, partial [Lacipirellulaceae bacterium]
MTDEPTKTDELVAYLLNDLSDDRRAEVESRLAVDPQWRSELERLKECLGEGHEPGDCGQPSEAQHTDEPPGDLVTRTCTLVDSVCDSVSGLSQTSERCSGRSRWTLADVCVATGVVLILSALVLPAIRGSRDDARRIACQNNLRTLGTALYDYAQAHDGQLPTIRANENAGMFAVKLASAGYLPPQELAQSLVCPESKLAGESTNRRVLVRVLSSRDMHGDVKLKVQLWPIMGGSYAYRLGHFDKYGQYQQVPFTGSRHAPMLSDAP